jgi:hypothetical protein
MLITNPITSEIRNKVSKMQTEVLNYEEKVRNAFSVRERIIEDAYVTVQLEDEQYTASAKDFPEGVKVSTEMLKRKVYRSIYLHRLVEGNGK